ncbi:hypothetical protein [Corallococcus sp. CA049B]|uniref:hypothetical protein n=1 Tax=Corallococcus sp. CA049B TaxID=2316730 RepID=UPI0011C34A48|nr:hypothetical protein [Corallococcus sp. CA049B]
MTALLVGALGQSGCAHGRGLVIGRITPGHFRFKTVVAVDTAEMQPDGWRAVCIHARITEGDSGATDVCKFEVGVPIRNAQQGEVPLEVAQQAAAYLANAAAHEVLSKTQPGELIAILCRRFKNKYEHPIRERIAGARVSKCQTPGLEPIYFDIPRKGAAND